ncbi:2-oxoglutarate dehydrogenase complex dihydrolipoyllysine-residue succinyltransferase [Devosia oryziradicis]|uniref:Dihydrolipoyllysine-residue succinyltransferase component of 2-oxoglutarate dehydrogenase complex n=1 Tax=Devosia oryziradicis TaxID=2801335 RepID=A0ABX7BZC9_9HYPH|nr:2-oxoglutarate dehydrogenase complex dihydrolipoyllysine-residue succinyltransferase [Devosia oryziradicis]QQR37321.1 2-oxoglutarate dehydrogenase complex dihydrolipoyllysine-residue succinyltransferase [Devosia oryziradicis]
MSTEIRVPTLGESVTEATIGQWFKKVGDTVAADEPIVELETDKVTIEVPAPAAGVLEAIAAEAGATVDVGALLGAIGGAGAASGTAVPAAAPAPAKAEVPAANAAGPEPIKPSGTSMPPAPSAQKLINENGVNGADIDGSGKRGQVLKEDVLAALAKPAAPAAPAVAEAPAVAQAAPASAPAAKPAEAPKAPAAPRAPVAADDAGREERVKMTRLRQTIARRLKDAQNTAAMLTTFNEVDMKPVMDLRNSYKELFEKKHGVKLGFMGFFTKAVVHALKEIPAVNAEIDGDDLIYKQYAHIGVAVGTEKGLVVPVVRNADQMSIAEIEKEIGNLGKKARDGQLSMADMQGGTFTISNGGVYGSLMSTPILNAPQSGILGMHKIQERPVVVGGQIVIRPMMYLALSYDHRIVDGKEAVTFLVRVKESLEAPERLVLDL